MTALVDDSVGLCLDCVPFMQKIWAGSDRDASKDPSNVLITSCYLHYIHCHYLVHALAYMSTQYRASFIPSSFHDLVRKICFPAACPEKVCWFPPNVAGSPLSCTGITQTCLEALDASLVKGAVVATFGFYYVVFATCADPSVATGISARPAGRSVVLASPTGAEAHGLARPMTPTSSRA